MYIKWSHNDHRAMLAEYFLLLKHLSKLIRFMESHPFSSFNSLGTKKKSNHNKRRRRRKKMHIGNSFKQKKKHRSNSRAHHRQHLTCLALEARAPIHVSVSRPNTHERTGKVCETARIAWVSHLANTDV